MSRILFLLLLIAPLFANSQVNQKDSNGLRQGKWQKSHPNGRLAYKGFFRDDKPIGKWIRYYEGGQIKARIEYVGLSDSAVAVLYDQFGRKMAEGSYLKEKREGVWQIFSENRKISEETYVKGRRHGTSRKYYPSGEVLEVTEWANGIQEGTHKILYKNGNPFLQCKYTGGKRNGLCVSYKENGRVELEAYYTNNLRDGEWKYYDNNGGLSYTLEYKNGKLLNPEVRDSVDINLQKQYDKRRAVADPEDFIQDPTEYMIRMQQNR